MRKLACLVLVLGACGSDPEPPPPSSPWGVPISGGTMLMARDGTHAFVADPDRDRVLVVDLAQGTSVETALTAGDEPGRVVEDAAGRAIVALRRGGAIVTIDPATGAIVDRRAVCAEPRGVAWRSTDDTIHVACTDGQLITFAASGGDATRRLQLDRDLRDVVVVGDQLVVTRFRTAEILTIDATGAVARRVRPPMVTRQDFDNETGQVTTIDAKAEVAWRAIGLADGRVVVSHARKLDKALGTQQPGGYGGGGCHGGPVEDAITVMQPDGTVVAMSPGFPSVLPVDIAVSPDGTHVAVVDAGSQNVRTFDATGLGVADGGGCPPGVPGDTIVADGLGAPTSVGYEADGGFVVFYPEAPALVIHRPGSSATHTISLPGEVGYDAGRELFHQVAGVGLACASCHPEGRDDGEVWDFKEFGLRRTQVPSGHILSRAPYHWSGDQANLPALLTEVFEHRMAGGELTDSQKTAIGPWLDRLPAPAPITGDPAAVARGQALFESADVGCIACHNGSLFTNNGLFDVGTGGRFKVPSLRGVAARAPYLHDGCAATLMDRLTGSCGGLDNHGHVSQLDAGQLADLIAYVESL